MLLVTPIGMSLKKLAEKVGGKRGRLAEHKPVSPSWNLDADKTGKLVYFPDQFEPSSDHVCGITKAQLLAQGGGNNIFQGWSVTVVEGEREIDLEAIKINPPPNGPDAKKYKNAYKFFQDMKTGGLSGLTPEEWLILHAEGVRRGEPFESDNTTLLLAAHHKVTRAVPDSFFNPELSRAEVGFSRPRRSAEYLGARRAAR